MYRTVGLLAYKQVCQNFLLVYSSSDTLRTFTQPNNPVLPEQVSVPSVYSILWPSTNITVLNYYLHLSSNNIISLNYLWQNC